MSNGYLDDIEEAIREYGELKIAAHRMKFGSKTQNDVHELAHKKLKDIMDLVQKIPAVDMIGMKYERHAKFYNVETIDALIDAQERHIISLQGKNRAEQNAIVNRVPREG